MKHFYSKRKTQSNNYSGYSGIRWDKKTKKWKVYIKYNWKNKYIGTFHDINHAITVRENCEDACDSFKYLKVISFQTLRYKNNEFYLLGSMSYSALPIYIEVGPHV